MDYFLQHRSMIALWTILMFALIASGFYSPWMVEHAASPAEPDDD
jgi:hypothetical protein